MFSLLLIVTLSQSPTLASEEQLSPKVGLFSEPQVGVGTLVGRVGLGTLTGLGGAALGGGVVFVGIMMSFATGGIIPAVISGIIATGLLAVGNALGAAALGGSYGRDFVDSLVVAIGTSVIAAVCLVGAFTFQVAAIPLIAIAVLMPMSTPALVQLFKPAEGVIARANSQGLVLASF